MVALKQHFAEFCSILEYVFDVLLIKVTRWRVALTCTWPRAYSGSHVPLCMGTNVHGGPGLLLLWLSSVRSRPPRSHWPCAVSDAPRCPIGGLRAAQVVWTHAGVPVMWPAAKLVKSERRVSREQTRRFTLSHRRNASSCRTKSCSETGTMFRTCSSLWLTILSPFLPSMTPVRFNFIYLLMVKYEKKLIIL